MAAKTATVLSNFDVPVKNERVLMNKLRAKGLEYVSSTGKVIAAKIQPVIFCHCPQKCKNKLPQEKWDALFKQFYELGDQNKQNQYLQSHILIKAVHLHNWESEKSSPANKRRVTCRYHVPDLSGHVKLEDYIKKKGNNSIEVCQKAFMNCYGLTEKRARMQRERCISRLAPGHYKHSPFGKKHKTDKICLEEENFTKKNTELSNELNTDPLDLSSNKKKQLNGENILVNTIGHDSFFESENEKDQPLDLSHSKLDIGHPLDPSSIKIDKMKLYEIAKQIGVTKERLEREMALKCEQLVMQNVRRHKRYKKIESIKFKKNQFIEDEDSITNYNHTEIENRSPSMKAITEQVVGLEDDFTILPIQTLNNGDLTITPVLGPVSKPVENRDIMRVNSFFQNQLWKPEYLGLSSERKLRSQSYEI